MNLKQIPRRKALLAVASTVLVATMVMGREKPAAEVVEATRAERRAPADGTADLDLSKLDRAAVASASPDGDPFAARSFNPPPPVQQAAAPQAPATPEAPPLPFRYLGKLIEDGRTLVFLANGEESLAVRAGQKVGEYRIDNLGEHEVVFTYLPLKTRQTLPL